MQNVPPSAIGADNHFLNSVDTSVLATVGGYKITVREFRDSYEFGPSFVKHAPDPKAAHLQYLINEKLIALDGYAHGIDTVASVRAMLKEIEDDAVITEWYRHNVLPLVHVDSSRVQRGVEEKSVGVTYRSVFSDDSVSIRHLKELLDRGISFDSLFMSLRDNPGFSLDEVTDDFFAIHEHDAGIARALAAMKPGTYSDIIQTGRGYGLVRLDHAKKDLIITVTAYQREWDKLERYYANQMLDSITVSYARGVLEHCAPTISGGALKSVLTLFQEATAQTQFDNQQRKYTADHAPLDVPRGEGLDSEPLVTSSCDRFTIGEFTTWYSYRRYKANFANPTASTLKTLKELIFTMVRDKRMIKAARAQGYGYDPAVQFEMNQWKAKLSYWRQKIAAIPQRAFTEAEVEKFYDENKHRYERDAQGTLVQYDQAREKVRNDLILFDYNKQLFYYLNSLKQRFPVHVDEPLLRSLHVSDENLSKKIDLLILKKGGTLPRRAMPSIDNEWEYFQ